MCILMKFLSVLAPAWDVNEKWSLTGKNDVNGRRALGTKITIEKNSMDWGRFYLFKALAQTSRQVRSETLFVQAHTINVREGTGNRRFSPVTLTRSTDYTDYTVYNMASSFTIRWFLHILGHSNCPVYTAAVFHLHIFLLCHRAGRAKPIIKDRSIIIQFIFEFN